MGSPQPWHFYLWTIPWIILPWTPLVILGAVEMYRRRLFSQPIGRFLICWFVPGVLVMSLSAWKHFHYVIPMLPGLCVPATLGMLSWIKYVNEQAKPRNLVVAVIFAIACVAGMVFTHHRWPDASDTMVLTIAVLLIGGLLVLYQAHRRSTIGQLASIFATAWSVAVCADYFVLPHFDGYRPSAELAQRANAEANRMKRSI